MLACARIGAIHSVVFGGFAAASLATRIDDAQPKVMVTADAGMRGGKAVPYKPLRRRGDAARRESRRSKVLIVNRGLDPAMPRRRRAATSTTRRCAREHAGRAGAVRLARIDRAVVHPLHVAARPASRRACSATPAATPSRSRRRCSTSSAASPARRCSRPATSAGSSGTRYIVYGAADRRLDDDHVRRPADPARRRRSGGRSSQKYKVTTMFSSPTAIRVLKKQDPAYMKKHDLSSLQVPVPRRRAARRADRALDRRCARRADHRQLLADRDRLADPVRAAGRRGHAAQVRQPVVSRCTATTCGCCARRPARRSGTDEKGVLAIVPPLPPGCMTTVWGDDERFVKTYFDDVPGTSWSTRRSTGDPRRGRLLLRPRAAPTT